MKKLLVATSALVAAAGSAAALDVSLGGNISISAELDIDQSGFDGADWDAAFTLRASGESMGWTYGGTLEFGMADGLNVVTDNNDVLDEFADIDGDDDGDGTVEGEVGFGAMDVYVSSASVYMGGDFMGRLEVTDRCANWVAPTKSENEVGAIDAHCLQWTGLELGGLELRAALDLDNATTSPVVGVFGDVMGLSAGMEYEVLSQDLDFTTSTDLGGFGVEVDGSWDQSDSDLDWSVAISADLGDFGVTADFAPQGRASAAGASLGQIGFARNLVTGSGAEIAADNTTNRYVVDRAGNVFNNDREGKDLMLSLTYGNCWTANVGFDPENNDVSAFETDDDITASTTDESRPFADMRTATGDVTGLYMWSIGYACDLHDGFAISASIGQNESRGDFNAIENGRQFEDEIGGLDGMTGSIGATVTF